MAINTRTKDQLRKAAAEWLAENCEYIPVLPGERDLQKSLEKALTFAFIHGVNTGIDMLTGECVDA